MNPIATLLQAARAFDCDYPTGHRIHPESPAVLGLRAAVRAINDADVEAVDTTSANTELAELRDLPAEVVALVHAVDRMRDEWAESDDARQRRSVDAQRLGRVGKRR